MCIPWAETFPTRVFDIPFHVTSLLAVHNQETKAGGRPQTINGDL